LHCSETRLQHVLHGFSVATAALVSKIRLHRLTLLDLSRLSCVLDIFVLFPKGLLRLNRGLDGARLSGVLLIFLRDRINLLYDALLLSEHVGHGLRFGRFFFNRLCLSRLQLGSL